jgi:hypothetical protein
MHMHTGRARHLHDTISSSLTSIDAFATHLHQCLPVLWQQQLLGGDAQGLVQPAGEGGVVGSEDGPLSGVGQVGGNASGLQMASSSSSSSSSSER